MCNFLLAAEVANWPLEIVKLALPAVFGFLGVWLGLWIWHLKKRSEPQYESLSYLQQKRLDSLMKAWSLLAYLTDVENPKAVVSWEKKDSKYTYYIRPEQAKEYITELSRMFYENGCGLLLGPEVKELFYEYRNHLYGVLLKVKAEKNGSEMILLENEELAKTLKIIYTDLNAGLRNELKKIET